MSKLAKDNIIFREKDRSRERGGEERERERKRRNEHCINIFHRSAINTFSVKEEFNLLASSFLQYINFIEQILYTLLIITEKGPLMF